MSVENHAVEESTTEAVHQGENQKAKSVDEESLNSTISDSSSKEESGSVGYEATAMTGNLPQKKSVSGSRKWFEQLEASERVAALAIADTPFLGALLALASWSPTKKRSGLVGAIEGRQRLDLTKMVEVKEFESHLRLLEEKQAPRSLVSEAKRREDVETHVENEKDTFAGGAPGCDALRIHPRSDSRDVSNASVVKSGPSSETLEDIFGELVVTFPSALEHVTREAVEGWSPILSPKPSSFMGIEDKDMLRSFDDILTYYFGERFLAEAPLTGESHACWFLSRLGSRQSLPLGALLLLKFESVLIESYCFCKGVVHLGSPAHSEEVTNAGPALYERVSKFLTNMQQIEATNVKPETWTELIQPFASTFNIGESGMCSYKDLFLTPLHFLGKMNINEVTGDIVRLDEPLASTLRALANHVGVSAGASAEVAARQSVSEHPDGKQAGEVQPHNQTGGSRKKKRKPKKRKNKKQVSGKVDSAQKSSSEMKQPVETRSSGNITKVEETSEKNPTVAVADQSEDEESLVDAENDVATKSLSPPPTENTVSYTHLSLKQPSNVSKLSTSLPSKPSLPLEGKHEDDGDNWETVEVRPRGSRNKKSGGQGGSRQNSSNNNNGNSKKSKGTRTAASRKKVANRKVVKEILTGVLDKVHEEVRRKKPVATKPAVNPWKVNAGGNKVLSSAVKQSDKIRRDAAATRKQAPVKRATVESSLPVARLYQVPESKASPKREKNILRTKASPAGHTKGSVGLAADQNTVPTFQETISAVSTPSNVLEAPESLKIPRDPAMKSSSSDSTNEVVRNDDRPVIQENRSENPPLPTLLNPENANSANSSVASSLEVPHSSRLHHSNSTADVKDVGYHLLDVCDRLSRDMSLFMSRRALALSSRRRERGALLAALQDTVSETWSGRCHVEMYGSCATQLDLPSSDIDVVVVGLDRNMDVAMDPQESTESNPAKSRSASSGNLAAKNTAKKTTSKDGSQHAPMSRPLSMSSYATMPLHLNGDRVRTLAAKLESHSWAVRVNAIPTASVPVIKMLCDPSRLTGASDGGDWMAHHQQMAAQAAAAAVQVESISEEGEENNADGSTPFPPQQLPWRGSDVMNGLLSLDITFEGPEHGGIGSTEFSAREVSDACKEAGLHPDATPFVQVVMVLKELLGQRKLNEPYSGGLSSYALLLLVVALLRERAVIREEIERVERQRKAMNIGDESSSFSNTGEQHNAVPLISNTAKPSTKTSQKRNSNQSNFHRSASETTEETRAVLDLGLSTAGPQKGTSMKSGTSENIPTKKGAVSSWASIAKTQSNSSVSNSTSQSAGKQGANKPLSQEATKAPLKKKPSFADAVANAATNDQKRTTGKISTTDAKKDLSSSVAGKSNPEKDVARAEVTQKTLSPTPKERPNLTEATGVAAASYSMEEVYNAVPPSVDPNLMQVPSFFARGYNDIVEVLCSGETTAGKLLMHFLLYYGEHFDAQSVAIDISGKHERPYIPHMPYSYMSPYIHRLAPGSIDPITGMLIVDPIVIYDPLEGAENNNVARRCFAWNSVRWTFAQSYATLSSAVERSATPPASGGNVTPEHQNDVGEANAKASASAASDTVGDLMDPSSPLLRSLISF